MKGITVTLYEEIITGYDRIGCPIIAQNAVNVENVLVSPTSSEDVINEMNLFGKRSVYTLAIPKGDTHDWKNKRVDIFGQSFKTFDDPVKGIDALIPLDWNTKVKVERYEQGEDSFEQTGSPGTSQESGGSGDMHGTSGQDPE